MPTRYERYKAELDKWQQRVIDGEISMEDIPDRVIERFLYTKVKFSPCEVCGYREWGTYRSNLEKQELRKGLLQVTLALVLFCVLFVGFLAIVMAIAGNSDFFRHLFGFIFFFGGGGE